MSTKYYISNERNSAGALVVFVERDQYEQYIEEESAIAGRDMAIEDLFANDKDVAYDWHEESLHQRIVGIATKALARPIWLHHEVTGECYVVTRWGTIEELKELADGEFVIELEPES